MVCIPVVSMSLYNNGMCSFWVNYIIMAYVRFACCINFRMLVYFPVVYKIPVHVPIVAMSLFNNGTYSCCINVII